MNVFWNLKQWLFERTLTILGIVGVGVLYQVGTIWYDNAMMISSAYGLLSS